jgi:large subunit ribosomal protein L25
MPRQIDLRAEPRTIVGKRMSALRKSGYVPANVYGPGMKSLPIQVEARAFQSIAPHATPTTMINLTIGSEALPRTVYLQHVQWQFVKHEPFHLDFYAVNLKRHMRSTIQLAFHGEAPAAKLADTMLLQPVAQVHVEALPDDMPRSIPVDLSVLTEIDQAIHARDLKVPKGVTLLDDPDELIARVQLVRGAVQEAKEAAVEQPAPPAGAPSTGTSS